MFNRIGIPFALGLLFVLIVWGIPALYSWLGNMGVGG